MLPYILVGLPFACALIFAFSLAVAASREPRTEDAPDDGATWNSYPWRNLRRFLGLSAPKFCGYCGRAIVYGTYTVHLGYDEETGAERTHTFQAWWCPRLRTGHSSDGYPHVASFPHA